MIEDPIHSNCFFCFVFQLDCRSIPVRNEDIDYYEADEFIRRKSNCTIFLGYTSNIVSSGLRETIRFLVEHKMVRIILFSCAINNASHEYQLYVVVFCSKFEIG